jgi:hypothetical protein
LASDEEIIESELKGKTLLVYMHILKSKEPSVGVREIQRALSFSSPSVSSYHPSSKIWGSWRVSGASTVSSGRSGWAS